MNLDISKSVFGKLPNREPVHSFLLKNFTGMEVEIIELGAIVRSIKTPDKNGKIEDVVLAWDKLEEYINDKTYFGATVGRVANRISGNTIIIDGKTYDIEPNALPDFGNNHLHGGVKGFNKALWIGEEVVCKNGVGVTFKYLSRDGEEGYPGDLQSEVTYVLYPDNKLSIKYSAVTNKTTLVNFTHHSYINLSGAGNGEILDDIIQINSDSYTPADEDLIPTGEIVAVDNSPFDFRKERTVYSMFNEMKYKKFKGYDINYILNKNKEELSFAALVKNPKTGRKLEVFTTQRCMHFYTGNFLDNDIGKDNLIYKRYGAICFEPQAFPDSPNHEDFGSIILKTGEEYKQEIIYKFSIE